MSSKAAIDRVNSEDSESDDDYGPAPASTANDANPDNEENKKRKLKSSSTGSKKKSKTNSLNIIPVDPRRAKEDQLFALNQLPSASFYEVSYMHRDIVTHIVVSKVSEFIITGSADGHVKFWKKMLDNIEFVKHYQAHLEAITDMVLSPDEKLLLTISSGDNMIKFFEVISFDMSNMISVVNDFTPKRGIWLSNPNNYDIYDRVAVSDLSSGKIRIFKADNASNIPIHTLELHSFPVSCMALNPTAHTAISVDQKGMIEYWDTTTFSQPNPSSDDSNSNRKIHIAFRYKSETSLYDLAKAKTQANQITVSHNGNLFVISSIDRNIRLFEFSTGKLLKTFSESLQVYTAQLDQPPSSTADGEKEVNSKAATIDRLEMGRKIAVEKELESNIAALAQINVIFDQSDKLLIFATLKGIKVVDWQTNEVIRIIGKDERQERFLSVALYQGVPVVDQQLLLARATAAASSNPHTAGDGLAVANMKGASSGVSVDVKHKTSDEILAEMNKIDPTLFVTSFKKRRFYSFSNREPSSMTERDVLNEKPQADEVAGGDDMNGPNGSAGGFTLAAEAVLHTSLGDITLKLFPNECPRTVENFTKHIESGYYNNVIFHRVIKGFMIQTGDPLGDGTGGESVWGGEFEDEFHRTLRHDRPFTLSMANCGPNTNGSQFFITTVPTPWLDNKHTVFGRVTGGFEIVTKIENLKVNKLDKPFDTVKILSAEVRR